MCHWTSYEESPRYPGNERRNNGCYISRSPLTRKVLDKCRVIIMPEGEKEVLALKALASDLTQMPKVKFKRNIHNMLLQKLSEANEYIDLLDFNMS